MTAVELNSLLASFRALQMGPQFGAKFAGVDAITGTRFTSETPIRMLDGKAVLAKPFLGGAGVEVLALAARVDGRFVDDVEADGVYYTVNPAGREVGFKVEGGKVGKVSLAALRAQKLRHQVALIATTLKEVR